MASLPTVLLLVAAAIVCWTCAGPAARDLTEHETAGDEALSGMPPLEYLFEWLGSAIARCLGLETPTPHPIRITGPFVSAIDESPSRTDLAGSIGLVFGSEHVAGDYTQYIPGIVFSTPQKEKAAAVLGFDVFVQPVR